MALSTLSDQIRFFLNEAEHCLEDYSRVKILILSTVGTWLCFKAYEIYDDFTWSAVKTKLFRTLIKLPFIRDIAAKEIGTIDRKVSEMCRSVYQGEKFLTTLPEKGMKPDEILKEIKKYQNLSKVNWRGGRVSGGVYTDLGEQLTNLVNDVYAETAYTNPLHPECFPGINKMEAEVVRMVCDLFNGTERSCGVMTTGGTESILLAMKGYREYGRHERGITKPELVAPVTAHAAFQKSCQYFGIRFRPVPIDPVTLKCDIKAMRKAITRNTIALIGSACNYPHGIIDDISSIAKLGLEFGIPVHVDCCLGGFLVAFINKAGFPLEPVDFSVPGVTSISADTHKYGFTPKGSSVIMYSDKKYRKFQFTVQTDWPGGIYASPTISGSRAGANIATCWASLLFQGLDGYIESTKRIITTQRYLKTEISKLKGINILGDPQLSVVAFNSKIFNIFRLSDMMTERGWCLNPLQFPSAIHICLTLQHVQDGVIDALLHDLKICLAECLKDPEKPVEGSGIIYGMAQSIPDRTMVSDIACEYLSSIYDTS